MQINYMKQRITIAEVIENEWFMKGYKPPSFELVDVCLDDVDAIFNDSGVRVLHYVLWFIFVHNARANFLLDFSVGAQDTQNLVVERREERHVAPVTMNAFELISTSQGLNLNSLFEKPMVRRVNLEKN